VCQRDHAPDRNEKKMSQSALNKIRQAISRWQRSRAASKGGEPPSAVHILPLVAGVRLDTTVPVQPRGHVTASKMTWISLGRSGRDAKTLETVILPN
jgi:hypothetical protein